MAEMQILCGFDVPMFEKAIQAQLRALGHTAEIYAQVTKKGVKNFIDQHPECNTVILQEIVNNKKGYTAEEVAALTDRREVNVIIVLSSRHIGSEYVKTLYSAGITNAIFQMGRKDGASAKDIVNLILNKRSRAEARKYYGIDSQKIEMGFIDEETYIGFYQRLHKNEEELLKNYLDVCSELSPKQIGDFTRRLPETEKEYLAQFEEFHMLLGALREFGIDLKIKRPKKTNIGLKVPHLISVQGDNISFQKDNIAEDDSIVGNGGLVENRADMIDTNTFEKMSIEELLMAAGMNMEDTEEEAVVSNKDIMPEPEMADGLRKEAEEALEMARLEQERVKQEALEKEKLLQAEKEQLMSDRKSLEEEKVKQEKEIERLKKQMEKDREKERKELQKQQKEEIARRLREEDVVRKQREEKRRKENRTEDMEENDDYELTYGGKLFPGWILVLLFVLCVVLIGFLFAKPYLSQFGIMI